MSSAVFPTLAGLGWSVKRTPTWQSRIQTSVSGRETRTADWGYPRYKWSLMFELLRDSATYEELTTLMGFYNARQGSFDSFLYTDTSDNSVTGQEFGTGDGTTTVFQLVRTYGGFSEPVLAPNNISTVWVAGTPTSAYTVDANTGLITFSSAPAASALLTATFSYYFRCRFLADNVEFEEFMSQMWSVKTLEFISIK